MIGAGANCEKPARLMAVGNGHISLYPLPFLKGVYTMKADKKQFWDIDRPLSYNCLFNFIVGSRGVGKTYGAKQWALKRFLKTGEEFVYVRRFQTELRTVSNFWDDIREAFPDCVLDVRKKEFYCNDVLCGRALSLSTAKVNKSVPYPLVGTIIFDEFILDKGYHRYLPDEVTNFLEMYSTIARLRDVRVLALSNALTITNPYFLYFRIDPPYQKEFAVQNDILIQVIENGQYKENYRNTRFGRLISDTAYGNYAIENEFFRDKASFIAKKTGSSHYVYTIVYHERNMGVWKDYGTGIYYLSDDCLDGPIYAASSPDHGENKVLLSGKGKGLYQNLCRAYRYGMVRFENQNLKNLACDMLNYSL